jgi:hypothetical protein
VVTLKQSGTGWTLLRDGQSYRIRGVGGQTQLARARAAGANSTRTWGSENAKGVLDQAAALGMTVTLGIWLSHDAGSYGDENYKNGMRSEVDNLLRDLKDHPALLMWALGNEINLGASTPQAWKFVNELALKIKDKDPKHPIMSVLADAPNDVISTLVANAPALDVLGVNSYAGLPWVDGKVTGSAWKGPYVVTEWGPNGHWEVPATSWGRPIEQTSAEKSKMYGERYQLIEAAPRALGNYVFLWGQKQERTPTWYGMFVEHLPELGLAGEACPTVDVMTHAWSQAWPKNRAPVVSNLTLAGKRAADNVNLGAGQHVKARVDASDPDADGLHFVWEVLREPNQLGNGGSWEGRPERINGAVSGSGAEIDVSVGASGEYRLFAYVLDGKGSVGTANVPFRVE